MFLKDIVKSGMAEKIFGIRPLVHYPQSDFIGKILIVNKPGNPCDIVELDRLENQIRKIFPNSEITILMNPNSSTPLQSTLKYYFENTTREKEKNERINKLKDKISRTYLIRRQNYDAIIILYDKSIREGYKDVPVLFSGANLKLGSIKNGDDLFLLPNSFFIYKLIKPLVLFFLLQTCLLLLIPLVIIFWFSLIIFMGFSVIPFPRKRHDSLRSTSKENTAIVKGLVSINIVNWNGKQYIEQCLESIRKQTYKAIEINIIDNFSTDGSLEYLKNKYPEIKITENKRNEGFSKAHNLAIRLSKGEYILPLNFDVILSENFVEEMLKTINMSDDIGMVSGRLYKKLGDSRSKLIDSTGIVMNNMFPGDRGENNSDNGQFDNYEYIFGASGAAPLYRRTMLEEIKIEKEYFDEDFCLYVEDVDLSWRAQLYGWKCIYTPYAIAYHERGVTRAFDDQIKKSYFSIGYRNRYLTIFKNSIVSNILQHIGYIILRETYFFMAHLSRGNFYILKVYINAIRLFPKMLRKRKIIQLNRRVTSEYMESFFF